MTPPAILLPVFRKGGCPPWWGRVSGKVLLCPFRMETVIRYLGGFHPCQPPLATKVLPMFPLGPINGMMQVMPPPLLSILGLLIPSLTNPAGALYCSRTAFLIGVFIRLPTSFSVRFISRSNSGGVSFSRMELMSPSSSDASMYI